MGFQRDSVSGVSLDEEMAKLRETIKTLEEILGNEKQIFSWVEAGESVPHTLAADTVNNVEAVHVQVPHAEPRFLAGTLPAGFVWGDVERCPGCS